MVCFHDYDGISVEISGAGSGLFLKAMDEFADYAWRQLGVKRVCARVDASNKRCRKLLEHLGFKVEGVLRQAATDGGDRILYSILREEYEQQP